MHLSSDHLRCMFEKAQKDVFLYNQKVLKCIRKCGKHEQIQFMFVK